MANSTPRRSSTTSLHDLSSPPAISRRASSVALSVSSRGGGSPQVGSERKKRARNLLRDFYGLAEGKKAGDPLDIGQSARWCLDRDEA
jgi:hypothetical protein